MRNVLAYGSPTQKILTGDITVRVMESAHHAQGSATMMTIVGLSNVEEIIVHGGRLGSAIALHK